MSEPFIERLSRFTPDGSGLDRDALLFAAGRASFRRNWVWPTLAGLLTVSQFLTLAVLWPRSMPIAEPLVANEPMPEFIRTSSPSISPDSAALWLLSRNVFQSPDGDLAPPAAIDRWIVADRPLYAGQHLTAID